MSALGRYVGFEGGGREVVVRVGPMLLVVRVRKSGSDTAISGALAPWRQAAGYARAGCGPAVTRGGACLADVRLLRPEPAVLPAGRGQRAYVGASLTRPT